MAWPVGWVALSSPCLRQEIASPVRLGTAGSVEPAMDTVPAMNYETIDRGERLKATWTFEPPSSWASHTGLGGISIYYLQRRQRLVSHYQLDDSCRASSPQVEDVWSYPPQLWGEMLIPAASIGRCFQLLPRQRSPHNQTAHRFRAARQSLSSRLCFSACQCTRL